MAYFLLTRLVRTLVTMLLAVTFVFILFRMASDPAREILGEEATGQAIAFFNARYGLDQPVWTQFMRYIADLLHGDFGNSFRDGRPALDVVLEAAPRTLQLGLSALLFALLLGIPAGIAAALRPGGAWDRTVMGFAVLGFSMPNFFLGILLIFLFTLHWRLLPSAGSGSLAHMIMPVLTIGVARAGQFARFTRTSMAQTLVQPFIGAALSRGRPTAATIVQHAMPNAALPTLTIVGLVVGGIIGGATVTEVVFAWPGMGRLLVASVQIRDLPVVQLIILLVTLTMSLTNLAVDLCYGLIDPRIHVTSGARHG